MIRTLADVVAALAGVECLVLLAIVISRVLLRRQRRREHQFRPTAEASLATYLAGGTEIPAAADPQDRSILREVALEALTDLRGNERDRLVALLEQLGFVDEARAELTGRRKLMRERGAETLAAVASPRSVPALTAGLSDRDVVVRTTCARALAEVGGADTIPAIAGVVQHDVLAAPGAVAAVVLALGSHHPEALAQLLRPDVAADLRSIAITVTSELRLVMHAPLLRACLAGDDDAAAAAARGLGMIGDADAGPALTSLASDPSRAALTRAAAVTALGQIGNPGAVTVLEPLTQGDEWALRAAADQALAELGEPGLAALGRAARSACTDARSQAEAEPQP